MRDMTIGKLAKMVGISVETIRFYEREGLIQSPPRRLGAGYRKYGLEGIQRLSFIVTRPSAHRDYHICLG